MKAQQELDVAAYCKKVSLLPVSFGYFVRRPTAFDKSMDVLLASIRFRLPSPVTPTPHPFFDPPEVSWWYRHALHEPVGKGFVRQLYCDGLAVPDNFVPQALHALFWAVEKGETDFVQQCVPLWSHEERLTGGLLRCIFSSLGFFESAFRALARTGDTPEPADTPRLDFFVADLATGRREAETGADFGVIIDVALPEENRFVKACRFQAKKAYADGKATIDLDQVEKMLSTQDMGYALFYHEMDRMGTAPSPTAVSVKEWEDEVKESRESKKQGDLGTHPAEVRGTGCDLGIFMTFGLCDPTSSIGAHYTNARDAAWALVTGRDRVVPVSHVLAVSLGRGPSGAEGRTTTWREIFGEIAREFGHHDR